MKEIQSSKAQSAKGLLSQAVVSNGLLFTAGFIHIDENGTMVEGSVSEMFARVLKNIEEVLKAANTDLSKVLKATIYVIDISILKELNEEYLKHFSDPMPAREAVCVSALPLGAQIEMSVIAEIG